MYIYARMDGFGHGAGAGCRRRAPVALAGAGLLHSGAYASRPPRLRLIGGMLPGRPSIRRKIAAAVGIAALLGFVAGVGAVRRLGSLPNSAVPLTLLGAGLLVAGAAAGLVWGRRVVEPLDRLARRAGRIAEGDFEARPDVDGPVEVRKVGAKVSAMAERLIEGQERLRENVESLERTNRELLEARDELVRTEKLASVGRLAAGIAHEVGNPLSSVTSLLEMLRKQADDSLVDHLESEARRIDEIVSGLLDFARPGEAPVTAADPRDVVDDTIELLRIQGRFDGVRVTVEGPGEELRLMANRDRLQQVLVNLLLNAVDAARESKGEREVAVRIAPDVFDGAARARDYSARREDDPEGVDYRHLRRMEEPTGQFRDVPLADGQRVVRIEVLDSGPGIDEDHRGRIFDPFFTTREPGQGMGLGLAIAARLTDEMGGVIDAGRRSEEGGSVFAVLLPRSDEEAG